LASLGSNFEDLQSHILLNPELSSLQSVKTMVQREEIRRKVMNHETQSRTTVTHGYHVKTIPHNENSSSSMPEHACLSKQAGNDKSFWGNILN
jgi:hypothetical protein